jgi:hypothetical protein
MGSVPTLEPLYTSAPILDYDDEPQVQLQDEEILASEVLTLAPEAFDAAILEALVAP